VRTLNAAARVPAETALPQHEAALRLPLIRVCL
jgi:hypothetical protein